MLISEIRWIEKPMTVGEMSGKADKFSAPGVQADGWVKPEFEPLFSFSPTSQNFDCS